MAIEAIQSLESQQELYSKHNQVVALARNIFSNQLSPTKQDQGDTFVKLKENAGFLTNGEAVYTGNTKTLRKRLKKKHEQSQQEIREVKPIQSTKQTFKDIDVHFKIPGVIFTFPEKVKDGLVWWFKKPFTTILTAVAIQAGAAMKAIKEISPAYPSAVTKADKLKLLLNKNIVIGSAIALSLLALNLILRRKDTK